MLYHRCAKRSPKGTHGRETPAIAAVLVMDDDDDGIGRWMSRKTVKVTSRNPSPSARRVSDIKAARGQG